MSLHTKLAEVMGEVKRIPKNGYNDFHKYKYVLEADLVDAVRDKLAARSVMLYTSVNTINRNGTLTTVHVTFTLADGESGETFTFGGAGTGEDKGDKGVYKALTGALKYGLMKLFLVPTGDDPEATNGQEARRGSTSRRTPPGPQAKREPGTRTPPVPEGQVSGAVAESRGENGKQQEKAAPETAGGEGAGAVIDPTPPSSPPPDFEPDAPANEKQIERIKELYGGMRSATKTAFDEHKVGKLKDLTQAQAVAMLEAKVKG